MKIIKLASYALIVILIAASGWSSPPRGKDSAATPPREGMHGTTPGGGPMFVKYEDAKFEKIVPELGGDGPEIAILRVDPKTGATQLLIRMVAPMRVPEHFHSANETHTVIKGVQVYECGGVRETLTPGGFNYIPAKDPHRAWLSAGALVFITVDGPWDINWTGSPPVKSDLGAAAVADVIKDAEGASQKGR